MSFRLHLENEFLDFFSEVLPYLAEVLNHCTLCVCQCNVTLCVKCPVLLLLELLYVFGVACSFPSCPGLEAACPDKVRLGRRPRSLNKKARRPEHAIPLDSTDLIEKEGE